MQLSHNISLCYNLSPVVIMTTRGANGHRSPSGIGAQFMKIGQIVALLDSAKLTACKIKTKSPHFSTAKGMSIESGTELNKIE